MKPPIPYLMFQGRAEEAMRRYIDAIEDSEIVFLNKYGPGQPGKEGSVMQAKFTLKGQPFLCLDNNVKHDFTFTPAFSIFITCESEQEFESLLQALSEDGTMLMPPDNYGFSTRFAWFNDCFGVSWQLNLE